MLQCSIEDIKQNPNLIFSRTHPDDKECHDQELMNGIQLQKPFTQNFRLLLPDNTIEYLHVRGISTSTKKGLILNGSINVITKQVELENYLKDIADNIDGALYEFRQDSNGNYSVPYMSEGIKQLYNNTPEEIYSDPSLVFKYIHPDDIQQVTKLVESSYNNKSHFHAEYRVIVNQTIKWISMLDQKLKYTQINRLAGMGFCLIF